MSAVSFTELMEQAQAGSEEAASAIYEQYRDHLLRVIRYHLDRSQPLRRLFDSHDFLQEAFKEAFQRKFCADVLKSPDTMLHYLVKIAENKVRDQQVKYFATQRHNLGRDKPLDAVARCERCQRPGSVTA